MEYIDLIVPGFGFASTVFLLLLGLSQFFIWKKTGYQRALDICLFSFFASVFSFEQFVVQSRLVRHEWTSLYVSGSKICFLISQIFYLRSLSYFVAIRSWVCRWYFVIFGTFSLYWVVAIILQVFSDIHITLQPDKLQPHVSYLVNSYTGRLGAPTFTSIALIGLIAFMNTGLSVYLLRKVAKSTRDGFLMIGLFLSIFTNVTEYLVLPLTFDFFIPMIFLANMFEAFRMSFLSTVEYIVEKDGFSPEVEELSNLPGKYQNSNLNDKRIEELAGLLTRLLSEQKLFLRPNLKLEDLAKAMDIPTYQVSQVLSSGLGLTFHNLINKCRIELAKEMLRDESFNKLAIIDIAYKVGYNSKSTFNTAFKKNNQHDTF